MTIYNEKTKRRVVPRWRSSIVAASSKDFRPLVSSNSGVRFDASKLPVQADDFEVAPDLGRAAELLATALRFGDQEKAKQAAEFVRDSGPNAPSLLMTAALSVLDGSQEPFLPAEIAGDVAAVSHLRKLLKYRPRSANLWVDMARHQAALGETEKARKSMRVGLALAPSHRWILRSASRFLLHAGDAEEAHRLLTHHPRTRHDPWLISAELASAQVAKRPPKFLRQAKDMLRPKVSSPAHVSELAAAVATLELESGSGKNARRLLKLALQDPTENALAQIEWAERESRGGLDLEHVLRRTPDAYEASCWVQYNDGHIEKALRSAREWLHDESYATRPVGMVCYLASFLDDYATIIETARAALARQPNEVLHRNNLIYALLSQGEIVRNGNKQELIGLVDFLRRQIGDRGDNVEHSTANAGLLFYRLGRYDEGKQLYEAAIEAARKQGNHIASALAATMNSREAIVFKTPWATEALAKAHALAKRVVSPGIVFYLRKLDALIQRPDEIAQILSPHTAGRFSVPKPLIDPLKDVRLEHTANGPVLWVPRHLLKGK